jgi:hypothetical protein
VPYFSQSASNRTTISGWRRVFWISHWTRIASGMLGSIQDWRNLSHHGQEPPKLAELRVIELQQLQLFRELLTKLKSTSEGGGRQTTKGNSKPRSHRQFSDFTGAVNERFGLHTDSIQHRDE